MNATYVHLISRTGFIVMSEICLLKSENDGPLQVFGNLLKLKMNVFPK